jgi:tRNA/tmRNA/rRNA uracil-C5-methylase (TrmA/RlmC/RlmD family)
MAALEAPRIVYLSCDPATLSRDSAGLRQHGYALESVRGFDLFPQTSHVEALAVMVKSADQG